MSLISAHRSATTSRPAGASMIWPRGNRKENRSIHSSLQRFWMSLRQRIRYFDTCDVGTPTIWAARYLHMNGKRRLLGSFTHGSMANALPQAIGAQVSHDPADGASSLSGDGGLAMLMGDLLSLRQLQLPVKLIVFNNSSLAFVELEMKAAGILDFGTDLQNPDFAKMSEAAGVLGLRAETSDQVRPMIEQALRHDGPALVEAIVSRQELSMPPTITIDQIKGFSLFMIKAVLDGRGNEIIDLAKTNLVR